MFHGLRHTWVNDRAPGLYVFHCAFLCITSLKLEFSVKCAPLKHQPMRLAKRADHTATAIFFMFYTMYNEKRNIYFGWKL
jgi:hypothetical protein